MWRFLAIFFSGGVLGVALGVAVGFFAFPYVFPPPEAMETLTSAERTDVLATGRFIHADPSDPIHYGSGGVTVYRETVFLEADFEVGTGARLSRLPGAGGRNP